jgi:predicted acyltransferase
VADADQQDPLDPSYVFFTAGLAMLLLGFLFFVIDVHGRRRGPGRRASSA